MLSELGKFGASFVMATQSLTRLEDLSRTLRETLFSNIGCLVAFQTSASDARYLTWELDRDQVTEEDLTSLPVHHCYVRATVRGDKLPTFSMALKPPEPGDPEAADAVLQRMSEYTLGREAVTTRLEQKVERHVAAFRREIAERGERSRKNQRSKGKHQPKTAGAEEVTHEDESTDETTGADGATAATKEEA